MTKLHFSHGTSNRWKKLEKIDQNSMKNRAKIVAENELFLNIVFSSIFAPFGEVLGEVLEGVLEVLGSLEASKTRQTRCWKVDKGQYGPGRRFWEPF